MVAFAASEDDVEQSDLVKAFDKAMKDKKQTAFHVNLDGESQKTLDKLGEKYTPNEYKGDTWEPKDDGLVLIQDGGVMKDPRETLLSQSLIEGTANDEEGYEGSFLDYMDDINAGVESVMDYVERNDVELSY